MRDLLALRAVKLRSAEDAPEIHGFRCMGVAERVPELGEAPGSMVHVWHVPVDILSLSSTEIERWSVDAPGGRHWILSERPFDEVILDSLKSIDVVIWGPERMARWIGEAVLTGELVAHSPSLQGQSQIEHDEVLITEPISPLVALRPLVELDSWLMQRGWEDASTSPVLMSARLWTIDGCLKGPEGDTEPCVWNVVEDPWSGSLSVHEPEEELLHPPKLRLIKPPEGSWIDMRGMPTELLKLLDRRKQGEPDSDKGPVSSIMLEWWRLDPDSTSLSEGSLAIPGWVIHAEGLEPQVLHGRNGRLYGIE